ncbi:MAG: FtsW/RodA/SpoVE family cell cycle protein [Acidobacteriota bacterium]
MEEAKKIKFKRTRPTLHLLLIGVIFGLCITGYLAIIWSGDLRGYDASKVVAFRDVLLLIPVFMVFFWLVRKQKFRGEMLIYTAAIFLFGIGTLLQFRLFADPEYGARGITKSVERREKAQAVRLLNIKTAYDDEKKAFMFGSSEAVPKEPADLDDKADKSFGLAYVLKSTDTYIPILAFVTFIVAFLIFKDDRWLLWIQSHSFILGLATGIIMVILSIMVLIWGANGKLFGQTPWESVKILFLLSYAGILADTYRHLRRTKWGLPTARHFIPFVIIAAMPVIPFFLLHDFGQLLVFFGVFLMLYVIAVRNQAKLLYAIALVAVIFVLSIGVSKLTTGFGIPGYVQFRFHVWLDMWNPPAPDTSWWKRDFENYVKLKKINLESSDADEIARLNREAWRDKTLQLSQGLFGINEGGIEGEGLGLGYPETVPVSDSDFIYAAISEETGFIGGLTILLALAVIVFGGTAIALGASDMFTKLLATGLTAFVAFQAIVNLGGVLRLLPMTGITLPFVSHGGWSLLTSFAMLGILLAISHRNAIRNQTMIEKAEEPIFQPVR